MTKQHTKGFMLNRLNQDLKTINYTIKVQKDQYLQEFYQGQKTIIKELIVFVNSVNTLCIN